MTVTDYNLWKKLETLLEDITGISTLLRSLKSICADACSVNETAYNDHFQGKETPARAALRIAIVNNGIDMIMQNSVVPWKEHMRTLSYRIRQQG
jgi:hypothetical protein